MVMTLSLLEVINVGLSNFSLQYQHNIKQMWAVRGIRRRTKVHLFKTLVLPVLIYGCEARKITKANERKLNSFQCQCLRQILRIRWQQRMKNKRVMVEINEISCEVQRRRWSWSGHILRREDVNNCFRHWGGQQKVERWERDQRPLGEGLLQEREARQGGRAEMWPRWQQATRGVGWTMWWPYAPTSTPSNDYYNDHDQADCWWDWRKIWKRGLAFDS